MARGDGLVMPRLSQSAAEGREARPELAVTKPTPNAWLEATPAESWPGRVSANVKRLEGEEPA